MKKRKKIAGRSRKRGSGRKVFAQFVGKVQMIRDGSIFVMVEGEADDIFVKGSKTRHALNGDTVRVALVRTSGRGGRREGEVVEIIERSSSPFVGIFHTVGAQAWVLMQSRSMPYDIEVDAEAAAAMGAEQGMKVSAVVERWDRGDSTPYGRLVDVLGVPGNNDTEMHAILAEYNLPYRFDDDVQKAAEVINPEISEADLRGRRDFRDVTTITIDPSDAKDFDDALSFRSLPGGNFEVGVHIADVSWYVRPGDLIDKEARNRGTSVYLVDRTVPMLPEKLCNNLCSLRPGEDKLTFSVVFEMTPKAVVKKRWIGRTVIRSDFRLDYNKAQQIITGQASDMEGNVVGVLNSLASVLRENRFKAGAINFDRPEMKVEVDENGRPVNVYEHHSVEANWLIEEFMLLANRTVAEFIATSGKMNAVQDRNSKTFVYRVHGEPDYEKLHRLGMFASNFGYRMEESSEGRGAAESLRILLSQAKDKPEFAAFENLALRSMAKAVYSTDNIGHYGLAFRFYTHFTSPIRRYPDLMVHRLLADYLSGAGSRSREMFEEECKYASARELVAADAERTSVKYKLVEYMEDKVGMEFDGTVSGITEWGMYVEIEPSKIEGMVSLREIRSDFYDFDENHYRLVGRRSRKVIRLGDKVRIRVKNANVEQRLLDYELVENLK